VPHEIYGSTEATIIAMQAWNKKWLTFVPNVAFWEFIPEEERIREKENKEYQPATVLINELEQGKHYELVLTQFYGMPLLRYRIQDLITVAAAKDKEAGINLPQITFKARLGDMISLASLAELDEKTLWQAIVDTGISLEDWSARKEYDQDKTYLRLYLELKEDRQVSEVQQMLDHHLRARDVDYRDLGDQLGLQPVRVTLLSPGTFRRYYEEKHKEGADLAHLKPPHMNATDTIIDKLLQLSREAPKHP
jgi:phenylacetate-coenzyme A ligase PaaK-like adenylate-forming protein